MYLGYRQLLPIVQLTHLISHHARTMANHLLLISFKVDNTYTTYTCTYTDAHTETYMHTDTHRLEPIMFKIYLLFLPELSKIFTHYCNSTPIAPLFILLCQ